MSVTASTLVQETARAQRAAATARRDAGPGAAAPDDPAGGFAGLLQSMSSTPQGAAAAGSDARPASPVPTRGDASRGGGLSLRTTALTTGAPEQPPRDGATASRSTAPSATTHAASTQAAAKEGQDQADATDGASEAARADAREAQPTGAENLAQWLMQMGLIPSRTEAGSVAATAGGAAGAGGDAAGSAGPLPGTDAAAGEVGGAGSASGTAAAASRAARAFRIPGSAAASGGEEALAVGLKAESGSRSGKDLVEVQGRGEAGQRLAAEAASSGAGAGDLSGAATAAQSASGHDGAAAAIDLTGLASAAAAVTPAAPNLAAAAAPAPAGEAANVQVQTAFDDPALAGEVVLQVGRLTRGGITEASLHLNPAEMGPIRVQIALDGQQARIDFSAQHAATRELLESALPALAQSLAADGLTLAGSSVQASPAGDPAQAPEATGAGLGGQGPGADDASGRSSAQRGRDEQGAGAGNALPPSGRLGRAPGSELEALPRSAGRADGASAALGLRALDLYA
jgi:flagellar hook-length control protein FliK